MTGRGIRLDKVNCRNRGAFYEPYLGVATYDEISDALDYFKMLPKDYQKFINNQTRDNGMCAFWDDTDKRCTIKPVRPKVCNENSMPGLLEGFAISRDPSKKTRKISVEGEVRVHPDSRVWQFCLKPNEQNEDIINYSFNIDTLVDAINEALIGGGDDNTRVESGDYIKATFEIERRQKE
jgi:hypothetical protein